MCAQVDRKSVALILVIQHSTKSYAKFDKVLIEEHGNAKKSLLIPRVCLIRMGGFTEDQD